MTDSSSREIRQKVDIAIRSIKRLSDCLMTIDPTEQRFLRDPSPATAESLKKIDAEVLRHYNESIESVKAVINFDVILQEAYLGAPTSESEVINMQNRFFREEIKKQTAPIASTTGCWARKVTEYRPGNVICARHDNKFKLMIVKEWTPQRVTCYDLTQAENGTVVDVAPDDCTLLPTMIPLKPQSRWEHSQGSTVLALPIESDMKAWPSVFEEAVIVSRPCDDDGSGGREKRGYILEFADGVQRLVPEQFVAYYRENWQKKA